MALLASSIFSKAEWKGIGHSVHEVASIKNCTYVDQCWVSNEYNETKFPMDARGSNNVVALIILIGFCGYYGKHAQVT